MKTSYMICQAHRWGHKKHAYLHQVEGMWIWGELAEASRFGSHQAAHDALRGEPDVTLDAAVLIARATVDAQGVTTLRALDAAGDLVDWTEPAGKQLAEQILAVA